MLQIESDSERKEKKKKITHFSPTKTVIGGQQPF